MPASDTTRFSVSLPAGLLSELDRRMTRRGYDSRSELIRDLIREKLAEEHWQRDDEELLGVLTITYDHHQRGLAQKLIDLQHDRHVNILCTTHVHIEHDRCVEAIIIRGRGAKIERLSLEIGGLRGVRLAHLTRISRVEL